MRTATEMLRRNGNVIRAFTILRIFLLMLAVSGSAAAFWHLRRPELPLIPRREYDLELRYAVNLPLPPVKKSETTPPPREKSETPSRLRSADGQIPVSYAALIRKAAERHDLPPEIIAGIIARESDFDPRITAPDGGMGLMQLMPDVCRERRCADPFDPEANIEAGTAHLAALRDYFAHIPDPEQRLLFALAAYNGGAGHVVDARQVARELKLDPDRWEENVEEAIQFLKFRSFHSRFRHGYCNADIVVNYVRSVQALAERFKSR